MPLTSPLIPGRLGACADRIRVVGLANGGAVSVQVRMGAQLVYDSVGGEPESPTPELEVLVPEGLAAGAEVRVRQRTLFEPWSYWSPAVIVEPVALSGAGPRLQDRASKCSQALQVEGVAPGAAVEVLSPSGWVRGSGRADPFGQACVPIGQPYDDGLPDAYLRARTVGCRPGAAEGGVQLSASPDPLSQSPVLGALHNHCQTAVEVSGLEPGVWLELSGLAWIEEEQQSTLTEFSMGAARVCSPRVSAEFAPPPAPSERWEAVRARALLPGPFGLGVGDCRGVGPWSAWREVGDLSGEFGQVSASGSEVFELLGPLHPGDRLLRVAGQIPGGDLRVTIEPPPGPVVSFNNFGTFGPFPAGASRVIPVPSLLAGSRVSVVEQLCDATIYAAAQQVVDELPWNALVLSPLVGPDPDELGEYAEAAWATGIYECAGALQVHRVLPGATVVVYQDGAVVGQAWAGDRTSVSVPLYPSLVGGAVVTARQFVGNSVQVGPPSPQVEVSWLSSLPAQQPPRVVAPIIGATTVRVEDVIPGFRVTVRSGGRVVGEMDAALPFAVVDVTALSADQPVTATVRLCSGVLESEPVVPVLSPCAPGPFEWVQRLVDYGSIETPAHDAGVCAGGGSTTRARAQVFLPDRPTPFPVLVMLHGTPKDFDCTVSDVSYRGYAHLGQRLASHGIGMISVDVAQLILAGSHDAARSTSVLATILREVRDRETGGVLWSQLALGGHSAGSGLAHDAYFNRQILPGTVRALVAIGHSGTGSGSGGALPADGQFAPDFLGITGSLDAFAGATEDAYNAASASRRRALFSFARACHGWFNSEWVDHNDSLNCDPNFDVSHHAAALDCVALAFLLVAFEMDSRYGAFLLPGAPLPLSDASDPGRFERTVVSQGYS